MSHLMAKSQDMGGQTLARHTWDVLARMADQLRLHPHLTAYHDERLPQQAFWAAFLHDFGKAAAGFQAVLRGEPHAWRERKHRHEVLSLAFIDWLFPRGHADRHAVLLMVAFHHKDAPLLFDKYGGAPLRDEAEKADRRAHIIELAGNIDDATRAHLWRWIDECAHDWARQLGFSLTDPPTLIPLADARRADLGRAMHSALRDLHMLLEGGQDGLLRRVILLRGLILSADHTASAGVEAFPDMPLTRERARAALGAYAWRDHQRAAEDSPPGSLILVAPTGSGKTEAALLWAARQIEVRPASRLFYTLPYQASMNAMYARLAERVLGYPPELVQRGAPGIAIRHSRSLLRLYHDLMEQDEAEPIAAAKQARYIRNRTDLNVYPIQVFSPYQMLKAAYSLKGYEPLMLDYTDAVFIFDEIHAYDPRRLALIVVLMGWLRRSFGARFLVMTATLPPMLRQPLIEALDAQVVEATPDEFARSQRHIVHLIDGRMGESIVARVSADLDAGRAVLVCLNRVGDAQAVYIALRDALGLRADGDAPEIILLHGRFTARDRREKERLLLRQAGVRRRERRPFVCVATQVVEVSLDVDFDALYSDPAPLEALIQRFGRVNRARAEGSPLLPVQVFTLPYNADAADPYKPYDAVLVQRALAVLREQCDGRAIDEGQVSALLGMIYIGELLTAWESEYQRSASAFERDVLGTMLPAVSADDALRGRFYQMFDGVEVVPIDLLDDYYTAREERGWLEASQYLVSISYALWHEFNGYGRIAHATQSENEIADHIDVPYDPEFGLAIDAARQAARAQRDRETAFDDGE
jgi:CRISPR-associated endonuclease/helicase Cas3